MALSNVFREPRRELTESAVGIAITVAVLGPVLGLDYLFGLWFYEFMGGAKAGPVGEGVLFGMLIGAVVILVGGLVIFLGLLVTHAIGEGVCNALQRRGVHLRPRVRLGEGRGRGVHHW
jgi:hypothetical protein